MQDSKTYLLALKEIPDTYHAVCCPKASRKRCRYDIMVAAWWRRMLPVNAYSELATQVPVR